MTVFRSQLGRKTRSRGVFLGQPGDKKISHVSKYLLHQWNVSILRYYSVFIWIIMCDVIENPPPRALNHHQAWIYGTSILPYEISPFRSYTALCVYLEVYCKSKELVEHDYMEGQYSLWYFPILFIYTIMPYLDFVML